MAVVDTGGLRKGLTIEMDNELVRVTDYQHIIRDAAAHSCA